MRLLIVILAALQLGLFAYFGLGFGNVPMVSDHMHIEGFVTLTGMVLAICLVPALILASVGKFLGIALALVLAPITALVLFFYNL